MSVDHPIHSKPSAELQVASLHQLSTIILGDPDRVFGVLGTPESRGEASLMLGAIHAYRSKSKPMPGRQKEYYEKLRAELNGTTPEQPMERECSECGDIKPLSEFSGSRHQCKECFGEIARERSAREPPKPATQPATEEEEPTVDTKTCTRCAETKPLDDFYKGQGRCKPCFNEVAKKRRDGKKSRKAKKDPVSARNTEKVKVAAAKPEPDPDPPLSDGWARLADPRLSDLRLVQELVEKHLMAIIDLEAAADVATAIALTFGPKDDS